NFSITNSYFQGGHYYGIDLSNIPVGLPWGPQNSRQKVNSSFVLANSVVADVGATGLYLSGTDNGAVSANTFYPNHRLDPFGARARQMVFEAGGTNLEFAGNTIRDAVIGSHASGIEFAPTIAAAKTAGISVHDNSIHDMGRLAIFFDEAEPNSNPAKPY